MAKLKLTNVEYGQLSHKLTRLAANKGDRSKDQQQLVSEAAKKFDGTQLAYTDDQGYIEVPLQRRHLRLLEEIQLFTLKVIEETTIPELQNRLSKNPDKAEYYTNTLTKASELKSQTNLLLERIRSLL
jgi:hypothetical protein